ncbi:hypothetical protein Ataiwa_04580 [Algoriphagus taiwanensis]|uniref:Uncharacterized protein n=1 Tax=Algoriphagus taiwanensis TaxID=1445656 RepID=A0ABQ6PW49_9BACT|nr:hypothetical protein Ataiwa_04580 [Algoriphagus taiwanensis]
MAQIPADVIFESFYLCSSLVSVSILKFLTDVTDSHRCFSYAFISVLICVICEQTIF